MSKLALTVVATILKLGFDGESKAVGQARTGLLANGFVDAL